MAQLPSTKTHKNFTNVLHRQEDFHMTAEWHIFATSRGKLPSDGICGIVKRSAARASLQAVSSQRTLTP